MAGARFESNGIPPPNIDLPFPEKPEVVTANLIKITELVPDARMREVLGNLTRHLHQFLLETKVTTEEWTKGIAFLTEVGANVNKVGNEFVLLSDVLGVSALVDTMNNPPLKNATESCLEGPAFTPDAPDISNGASIIDDENGIGESQYLFVEGKVTATDGKPIENAIVETWETDDEGIYDIQHDVRDKPNGRGRFQTDSAGNFSFRGVVPSPYPIPQHGPVGTLLKVWNRHNMRAAHVHFMFQAPGYRSLTTQLYPTGDKWATTDCVFAPKKSLLVDLKEVTDAEESKRRGIPKGAPFKLLRHDFVLLSEKEAKEAKELSSREVPDAISYSG